LKLRYLEIRPTRPCVSAIVPAVQSEQTIKTSNLLFQRTLPTNGSPHARYFSTITHNESSIVGL